MRVDITVNAVTCTCINLSCVFSLTQDSTPVETQERPFPHRQQQQASIKQQLVNVYVSFYFPFSCYGNRLGLVDVSICSQKLLPANKRGVRL